MESGERADREWRKINGKANLNRTHTEPLSKRTYRSSKLCLWVKEKCLHLVLILTSREAGGRYFAIKINRYGNNNKQCTD